MSRYTLLRLYKNYLLYFLCLSQFIRRIYWNPCFNHVEMNILDMVLKWMDVNGSHNLANGYKGMWISNIVLHGYRWIWIYLFVNEYGWIWILQTSSMSISIASTEAAVRVFYDAPAKRHLTSVIAPTPPADRHGACYIPHCAASRQTEQLVHGTEIPYLECLRSTGAIVGAFNHLSWWVLLMFQYL